MQRKKLDVLVVFFAYSGNGGVAMQLPAIADWWAGTLHKMMTDDRIGRVHSRTLCDTPITMTRNQAARMAVDGNYDVLVMVDSDNEPDLYLHCDRNAKPWWDSSFDFLYQRAGEKPTIVFAPYCGPPPHPTKGGEENVYVFHWDVLEGNTEHFPFKMAGYSRQHAAIMGGIQEAAAGPTGLIMMTTDVFKYANEAPFYYEWTDKHQQQKASTEDVTFTRDVSMRSIEGTGENAVFCNWDAWAGHHKPKCVGRPVVIPASKINQEYKKFVLDNIQDDERLLDVKFGTVGTRTTHAASIPPVDEGDWEPQSEDSIEPVPSDEPARNGVEIVKRKVGKYVVKSAGFQTGPADLQALSQIVAYRAQQRPGVMLRIIEVGSWVGESALAMAQGLGDAGGIIYCVDHWQGAPGDATFKLAQALSPEKAYELFMENTSPLIGSVIRPLRGASLEVAASLPPQGADLVFIDADHSYEGCKADILAWLPHLRSDGIIFGHDFEKEQFPGVVRAVKEIFGDDYQVIAGTWLWVAAVDKWLAKQPQNTQPEEAIAQ